MITCEYCSKEPEFQVGRLALCELCMEQLDPHSHDVTVWRPVKSGNRGGLPQFESNRCHFCKEVVDLSAFDDNLSDFKNGTEVYLFQGDPQYRGLLGTVLRRASLFNPTIFVVQLKINGDLIIVRFDHMMIRDHIDRDKHYRELYEYRRRGL